MAGRLSHFHHLPGGGVIFTRLAAKSRKLGSCGRANPAEPTRSQGALLCWAAVFDALPSHDPWYPKWAALKSTALDASSGEPCSGSPIVRPGSPDSPGAPLERKGKIYILFDLGTQQMPIPALFHTTHMPFFHHCSHFRLLVGSTGHFLY